VVIIVYFIAGIRSYSVSHFKEIGFEICFQVVIPLKK
jgi:hypothetical protein